MKISDIKPWPDGTKPYTTPGQTIMCSVDGCSAFAYMEWIYWPGWGDSKRWCWVCAAHHAELEKIWGKEKA